MKTVLTLVPCLWLLPPASQAQEIDLAGYEDLLEPRITSRPAETMLVVEATGDPNQIGGRAFGLLFQLYFSIPATPKSSPPPIPRARWPADLSTPAAGWTGQYALPVPDEVPALPAHMAPVGMQASIETWDYGEVAEILHVGPYDAEQPTLDRLHAFVDAEGYELFGGHEEEYLRGPTMAGPGDPAAYLTLLRYRVRKRGESAPRDVGEGTGVAEIRAARTASNAALAAHDVDAITSLWTEDVAITAGSGTAAIGRDTWRRAIAAQLERYPDVIYIRTPDAIKLSAVTPIASEHGTWTGTWSSENGPVTSRGEYQAMWRRDPDGWRLRSQLFVTLSCEGSGCGTTRTP